jgi:hypothetical protein
LKRSRRLSGLRPHARSGPRNILSRQYVRRFKQWHSKGISGNPGGKSKYKIYSVALRVEVNRIDPNNPDRRKVNALAEKLVSCALAGEGWAFKEIGDRLEGKAVQLIEHSGTDDRDVKELTDAELTAIIRSQLKIVPVETEEERPEGEPLN